MNSTKWIIIYLLQHNDQFRVNWYAYKQGRRYSEEEYVSNIAPGGIY